MATSMQTGVPLVPRGETAAAATVPSSAKSVASGAGAMTVKVLSSICDCHPSGQRETQSLGVFAHRIGVGARFAQSEDLLFGVSPPTETVISLSSGLDGQRVLLCAAAAS